MARSLSAGSGIKRLLPLSLLKQRTKTKYVNSDGKVETQPKYIQLSFLFGNSKSLPYSDNTSITHFTIVSIHFGGYMCKQSHLQSASLYSPMIRDDSHVVFPLKAACFFPAGTCISVAELANREMVVFGIMSWELRFCATTITTKKCIYQIDAEKAESSFFKYMI